MLLCFVDNLNLRRGNIEVGLGEGRRDSLSISSKEQEKKTYEGSLICRVVRKRDRGQSTLHPMIHGDSRGTLSLPPESLPVTYYVWAVPDVRTTCALPSQPDVINAPQSVSKRKSQTPSQIVQVRYLLR